MFCFHGGTQTIQSFVYSQIDSINGGGREELFQKADSMGMILIFPQALVNNTAGYTLWNDKDLYPQTTSSYDDIGFVLHMIDTITQSLSVDTSRIYISGFSNGADFTQFLAGQIPCTFAAAAAIAGRTANQASHVDTTLVFNPPASTPIAVMIVRGKRDSSVPYFGGLNNNGTNTSSVFQDLQYWLNSNFCNQNSFTSFNIGDTVETRTYNSCSGQTQVKVVSLKYMGHRWPDANDNYFWNANTEIIDFVLQFTRCSSVSGVTNIANRTHFIIFPNPSIDVLFIESDIEIDLISIFNSQGQLIKIAKTKSISISELSDGHYFVKADLTNGNQFLRAFIKATNR
ncbi:MAG: T9SS type A sorting domain-containing protein [Bacteroidetes bacterium]|nr:T9SS type A sorting domain-containing protein [Bacteroidota bacterium]